MAPRGGVTRVGFPSAVYDSTRKELVPVSQCVYTWACTGRKSYSRLILFLVLVTFAAIRPALNASDALGLAVLHGGLCGKFV